MIPEGLRAEVNPVETDGEEQHTWKVFLPQSDPSDKTLVVKPGQIKLEEPITEKTNSEEPKTEASV